MSAAPDRKLILIIEDYEDAREMYAEYLEMVGYDVATAADGEEGLAKARALKPDAIVMDMSLPKVDGWEVTRRLKGDPATRSICIVAVTGHGELTHVDEAWAAGVDQIEVKPVLPNVLADRLERCFRAA